jgi:hypothetical protein
MSQINLPIGLDTVDVLGVVLVTLFCGIVASE